MSTPEPVGYAIVYQDDALLVLDKPAGLLSVPGRGADKQDCLSSRVQRSYPTARVVHRLDMGTSGLMLMALGGEVQRLLNDAFARRTIHKRYQSVVDGLVMVPEGSDSGAWQPIDLPIALDWPNRPLRVIDVQAGKPSQTRWQVVSVNRATHTSRLQLEPLTGRSHQLRVHLRAIGHPILGDALYAPADVLAKSARLLLHATELVLTHPVTGRPMRFVSPTPF